MAPEEALRLRRYLTTFRAVEHAPQSEILGKVLVMVLGARGDEQNVPGLEYARFGSIGVARLPGALAVTPHGSFASLEYGFTPLVAPIDPALQPKSMPSAEHPPIGSCFDVNGARLCIERDRYFWYTSRRRSA